MRTVLFGSLIPLILMAYSLGSAQTLATLEYEVKAAFLLNFTHFVDWPEEAFAEPDDAFVIGVLGEEDPFEGRLDQAVEGRSVQDRPTSIRYGRTLEELGRIHMLFVCRTGREDIADLVAHLATAPVLTVGETSRFTAEGGMIRFHLRQGKVAIEINRGAVNKAGLRVSPRLLALADIYSEESDR
jgi:hypothetical protein